MNIKILGIDPGTAIVGYSIVEVENNKYILRDYGHIETEATDDMPKRLEIIYDNLESIIKLWKPDIAVIEELFFFKNQKTVIKVGQARGVINLVCQKNGLDIYDYTPLQIKMAITGYGRATKKQVQEMVKILTNLKELPKPDDVADAIAIAITHIHTTKNNLLLSSRINTNNFKKKSIKDINTKKISNKMTLEEYKKMMEKVKK